MAVKGRGRPPLRLLLPLLLLLLRLLVVLLSLPEGGREKQASCPVRALACPRALASMLLHEGRTKQAPHRVHPRREGAVDSVLTFDGIRNRRRGESIDASACAAAAAARRGGQRHGMRRRVGWIPWIRMLVVLEFGVLLHHLLRPGVGGEVVRLAIVIYRTLGRRSMGSSALGLAHCGRAKDPRTSAPDATRIAPARASTLGPRSLASLEHQKMGCDGSAICQQNLYIHYARSSSRRERRQYEPNLSPQQPLHITTAISNRKKPPSSPPQTPV